MILFDNRSCQYPLAGPTAQGHTMKSLDELNALGTGILRSVVITNARAAGLRAEREVAV